MSDVPEIILFSIFALSTHLIVTSMMEYSLSEYGSTAINQATILMGENKDQIFVPKGKTFETSVAPIRKKLSVGDDAIACHFKISLLFLERAVVTSRVWSHKP